MNAVLSIDGGRWSRWWKSGVWQRIVALCRRAIAFSDAAILGCSKSFSRFSCPFAFGKKDEGISAAAQTDKADAMRLCYAEA
jgi:hypothetical protein